MTVASDDSWTAGDAYEAYMGRFSRALARVFLDWLGPKPSAHWLELGCGTGALTSAICEQGQPASVVACDPSAAFIEHARRTVSGPCTFHVIPPAGELPRREGGFDAIVSGLVLNFIPEPGPALKALRERCSRGGTVAAYVWDYTGGVEFLRYFWEAAVDSDPGAAALDEGRRFGFWQPQALASLLHAAGLAQLETGVLEVPTEFAEFEDYWRPFLGGSGPAPSYVASLDATQREQLRARLERRVPADADGRIRLRARAWAARGVSR